MKVLIVEDDRLIAELERDFLVAAGNFETVIAETGTQGMEAVEKEDFDAVLLDLMLPEMDGISVCKEIRKKSNIPIIMVTAKREDVDKIKGLAVGADDYIVKPFSPSELVARVRAHISIHERIHREYRQGGAEEKIEIRNLEIYPKARRIFKEKEEISLTNKEFDLLLFFIQNPNIAFSKETLFDRIWGIEAIGDISTVTVHVNRLREKIETEADHPMIQTVWGIGYRFRLED